MHRFRDSFRIIEFALFTSILNVSPANLVNRYRFTSVIINLLLTLNTIRAQDPADWFGKKAICSIDTTSDGLKLANCSGSYDQYEEQGFYVVIPYDLPLSIEVLDVSYNGGAPSYMSRVRFLDEDVLKRYTKLKRIIQRNSVQFKDANPITDRNSDHRDIPGTKAMKYGFKDLPALEYLEFSNCNLNERWYTIIFPKSLKTLNLSDNILSSLDVNMCNIRLQSVPKFHTPPPPITTLRMKGCPLSKMTILDIAPLCELTILELQFPAKTHYLTETGYCECVTLKRWIDHMKLQGADNIQCADPKNKPTCSESVYQEAEGLRKKCPLLKAGDIISKKAFSILKYIFFSILFLLLLALLVLYIIRHYHLREWWAEHHARMSTMDAAKMEEEEESLKNQSSSSEDSGSTTFN